MTDQINLIPRDHICGSFRLFDAKHKIGSPLSAKILDTAPKERPGEKGGERIQCEGPAL